VLLLLLLLLTLISDVLSVAIVEGDGNRIGVILGLVQLLLVRRNLRGSCRGGDTSTNQSLHVDRGANG
jgi:hypothetical protein